MEKILWDNNTHGSSFKRRKRETTFKVIRKHLEWHTSGRFQRDSQLKRWKEQEPYILIMFRVVNVMAV